MDCGLPTGDCRLGTADCGLPTVDCRLGTADCGLPTVDCRLQHPSRFFKVYLQSCRTAGFIKNSVLEKSNFVDQIRIFCRSGHGGAGNKHFMRNKFTALGGPDGGDGGRGAHIILRGNSNLWTLLHLRYYKNVLAEDGERGGANNCHGRDGKDIIIEVPLGTIARDEETGAQEVEILEDGQEIIWMPGGKGGLGNSHFATPTNQAPEHAQPGLPGLEGWKVLELKVLADVGLVGFRMPVNPPCCR